MAIGTQGEGRYLRVSWRPGVVRLVRCLSYCQHCELKIYQLTSEKVSSVDDERREVTEVGHLQSEFAISASIMLNLTNAVFSC